MTAKPKVSARTVPVLQMGNGWIIVNRQSGTFIKRKTAESALKYVKTSDERRAQRDKALIASLIVWKPKTPEGKREVLAITGKPSRRT